MDWSQYADCLSELLNRVVITDDVGKNLINSEGFRSLKQMTVALRAARKTLFLIGNGASASIASHVAADMGKNAGVRTEVFTDLALLTAVANDISYEEVFAEPIRLRLCPGDLLAAISSSGHSPNILRATEECNRLGGTVVTFSAMQSDNPLRCKGTLNFYIPAETYGTAEICHTAMLHYWIDLMVNGTSPNNFRNVPRSQR